MTPRAVPLAALVPFVTWTLAMAAASPVGQSDLELGETENSKRHLLLSSTSFLKLLEIF